METTIQTNILAHMAAEAVSANSKSTETGFIDEQQLIEELKKRIEEVNRRCNGRMEEKARKMGVNMGFRFGGLMGIPYCDNLKTCIDNVFAIFNNNFSESINFQLHNIKMIEKCKLLDEFLSEVGLADEFARYVYMRENDKSFRPTSLAHPVVKQIR